MMLWCLSPLLVVSCTPVYRHSLYKQHALVFVFYFFRQAHKEGMGGLRKVGAALKQYLVENKWLSKGLYVVALASQDGKLTKTSETQSLD